MEIFLVLATLATIYWIASGIVWLLKASKRKYHAEHVVPLQGLLKKLQEGHVAEVQARNAAIAEAELFSKDLQAEINHHQELKSAAHLVLNPLQERKARLHKEMENVRDSLARWHRGSKSFWGNKNLKIKDDSILGWFGLEQTVAQKENLESDRSSLHRRIGELKQEQDRIYQTKIAPAKKAIDALFKEKSRLAESRKNGRDEGFFRGEARIHEVAAKNLEIEIEQLVKKLELAENGYKEWKKRN